jgi:hypothetical protein
MVHERLEIEEWISRFPLGEDQDGEIICSPRDLAWTEQVRRKVLSGRPVEAVPTDVFVFGQGEPGRREGTKFGGLPYWPASQEWPRAAAGTPLTFIGQLCFADSRDIVGNVPGDVLMVFGPKESEYLDADGSDLRFFWRDVGDDDLMSPAAMPQVEFPLPPMYGIICRTHDYPGAARMFRRRRRRELLAVLQGTKIGGAPRWIQSPEPVPGRFLGALGSFNFTSSDPYPFVNVPEPVDDWDLHQPMWGDMGSVYLFLEGERDLFAVAQCY